MENHLSSGDQFLAIIRQIINDNLDNENFSVENLAKEAGLSRSMLHRKLIRLSGQSASDLITDARLTLAKELLEEDVGTVSEIAYRAGFSSPSYFIKVFKKKYHSTPVEYRKNALVNPDHISMSRKPGVQSSGTSQRYGSTIKVVAIILITIVVTSGVYYLLSGLRHSEPEKSIAVLPFINDSANETEMYFINGTMEAILNNLVKIEDLRVVSRTSVEQYRDNPKPLSEIAKEMNVNYILEGSGQKYGNNVRLTLQLLDATNDRHIWSEEYDQEIREIEDLFLLQSEISQLVAAEIKARVTPEEKQLMERIPTRSQTAYDLYQKGREEKMNFVYSDYSDIAASQRAEYLQRLALEYDSTFAWPYAEIAGIYGLKSLLETDHFSEYQDSIGIYLDYALSFDDQFPYAYSQRGFYHKERGEKDKAIENFNRTLELAPNYLNALFGLAWTHRETFDFVGAIENFHKAALIGNGPYQPTTLRNLSDTYFMVGFNDKSNYYSKQALDLDGDSAKYYQALARVEFFINHNSAKAIELLKHGYAIDTSNTRILGDLGQVYLYIGQYPEALRYIEKKIDRLNVLGQNDYFNALVTGYTYWMNGNREKAEYYFNQQIAYCGQIPGWEKFMQGQLAMVYACQGMREKAYESLRILNQMERMPVYVIRNLQDNYFFRHMEDEPEFMEIKEELIGKYQAEHERVRKWLEENNML